MDRQRYIDAHRKKIKKNNKPFIFVTVLFYLFIGSVVFFIFNTMGGQDALGGVRDTGLKITGQTPCSYITGGDPFEAVQSNRKWFLIGEEDGSEVILDVSLRSFVEKFTQDDSEFSLAYQFGESADYIEFEKGEEALKYNASISLETELPMDHPIKVRLITECGEAYSKPITVHVSHPVYVTWTMDWESYNVSQQKLDAMDRLSIHERDFPLTHFFNPRVLEPSIFNTAEGQKQANYVKTRRDNNGHEIQLHLHMFPDMVAAAGVEPQTEPRWGWHTGDGYDILVSGYPYHKMNSILKWSIEMFEKNGLGRPTGFRAGGWFADEGTLLVLQDNGFLYDSSGRTKYNLGTNNVKTHWDLQPTTQPYYPNYYDQNSSEGASNRIMQIMEIPNNGGDSTGMKADILIARFVENFNGNAVAFPTVVTYLSHPDYFNIDEPIMDQTLQHTDRFLYANDAGPVMYVTLQHVYDVYSGE